MFQKGLPRDLKIQVMAKEGTLGEGLEATRYLRACWMYKTAQVRLTRLATVSPVSPRPDPDSELNEKLADTNRKVSTLATLNEKSVNEKLDTLSQRVAIKMATKWLPMDSTIKIM